MTAPGVPDPDGATKERLGKVHRIELWHVSHPLATPFHPAWIPGYPQTSNNFTLLRVETTTGLTGLASGAAFEREREGLGAVLGPYVVGIGAWDLDTVRQRIKELSYLGWRNAWLEIAFWDLRAKAENVPMWKLLGAPGPTLECYASTGERRSPEAAAGRARELEREGFRAVKLRVHAPTLEEDVAVVRAAREAAPRLKLMVDANQGWRVSLFDPAPLWDVERAQAFAKACGDLGVEWIEEPLDMHDYEGYAKLARESPVKIAGGELTSGWDVLKVHLEKGGLHVYQPDCVFAGGPTDSLRVLEECRRRGLAFSPHTWTNGIGLLANAALAAVAPQPLLEYPIDAPGWLPEGRDGVLERPLLARDGRVTLPDSPGLGATLDGDALARHGEKFYEATPLGVAKQVAKSKGLLGLLRIAAAKRRAGKTR